jgi:threonine dehydratase
MVAVTSRDIDDAATRLAARGLRPTVVRPLGRLLLKCEHEQATGSFKIRGATNAMAALPPGPVVAASSGNHGLAVAAAAAATGRACTVVTTSDITPFKRRALDAAGATVVVSPPGTDARNQLAAAVAEEQGAMFVPPYDHPLVIAGQGTLGRELARDHADGQVFTTVLVPLGGGGLLAGSAIALRAALGSRVRIVGVEPAAGDDTARSLAAGRRITIDAPDTICDGARAQSPGELTFPIVQALVDDVVTATDDEVVDALAWLRAGGVLAEPTGALAVAAARRLGLGAGTVCVVTGGNVERSR